MALTGIGTELPGGLALGRAVSSRAFSAPVRGAATFSMVAVALAGVICSLRSARRAWIR
jgi:hypothetical protein